jgi:uncharacterized protein (DUF2164 family)
MADRVLFIGWDTTVHGREERAVEVFNETVGYYGRCQQEGRIEKFDAVFLLPNGSALGGYFELHGTGEQLGAIVEDEEFTRSMTDASLCVTNLQICQGYTNQGIADQMAIFQEAVAKVPQATG